MSRANHMLAALADGRWHSRADLFQAAGAYYLCNNAASELRDRGHTIEYQIRDGLKCYRLVGTLDASEDPIRDAVPPSAVSPSSPSSLASSAPPAPCVPPQSTGGSFAERQRGALASSASSIPDPRPSAGADALTVGGGEAEQLTLLEMVA